MHAHTYTHSLTHTYSFSLPIGNRKEGTRSKRIKRYISLLFFLFSSLVVIPGYVVVVESRLWWLSPDWGMDMMMRAPKANWVFFVLVDIRILLTIQIRGCYASLLSRKEKGTGWDKARRRKRRKEEGRGGWQLSRKKEEHRRGICDVMWLLLSNKNRKEKGPGWWWTTSLWWSKKGRGKGERRGCVEGSIY